MGQTCSKGGDRADADNMNPKMQHSMHDPNSSRAHTAGSE